MYYTVSAPVFVIRVIENMLKVYKNVQT